MRLRASRAPTATPSTETAMGAQDAGPPSLSAEAAGAGAGSPLAAGGSAGAAIQRAAARPTEVAWITICAQCTRPVGLRVFGILRAVNALGAPFRRLLIRRLLATALAASTGAPATAWAGPAPAAAPSQAQMDEVKQLYQEGKARYETLDYEGAIERWTSAYAKVPASEANAGIRNNLVYNIATAQEKAHELDGDVTHLKQARGLLLRYLEDHKKLYGEGEAAKAEIDKVEARIASLDAKISGVALAPPEPTAAEGPAAQPEDPKVTEKKAIDAAIRADPVLYKRYKSGKAMIISGSVLMGVGLVLLGAAGVIAADETLTESEASSASGLSFGLGVATLVTGIVLVPIGAKRFKASRREAKGRLGFAPMLHPRMAGASMHLTF